MKIDFKQTIVRLLFSEKIFLVLLACGIFVLLFSSVSFAPTKMTDSDLEKVKGQALFSIESFGSEEFWSSPQTTTESTYTSSSLTKTTSFAWTNTYNTGSANVIRIKLGIYDERNSYIRSFKLGYHYGMSADTNQWGWDLDVTNYFWGSPDHANSPLKWNGIFIDLGFDNLADNATRTLNYIELGTMSASGQVSGSFNTVNGMALVAGTGQNSGVMLRQTGSGYRKIHFNNDVLSFVFAAKYHYEDEQGAGSNLSGIFNKMPSYNTDLTT